MELLAVDIYLGVQGFDAFFCYSSVDGLGVGFWHCLLLQVSAGWYNLGVGAFVSNTRVHSLWQSILLDHST
jgi:hypothetical protein